MNEFKLGDRVRMKYYDGYATGEITIVTETECKVIFDGDYDLAYWYYPKAELEHEPKPIKETDKTSQSQSK